MDKTIKIRIEFTRPLKFFPIFSWLIRAFQKTRYSHVRLSWIGAGGKVPVIYEASGSSLKFIGPKAAVHNKVEIVDRFTLELTREQYRKLVALCMTYANVEYGKKQIIGIGLVYAFNLKKNPFADGRKSQVCSEIVGVLFEGILGVDTGLDLDIANPKQIYYFIKSYLANK